MNRQNKSKVQIMYRIIQAGKYHLNIDITILQNLDNFGQQEGIYHFD